MISYTPRGRIRAAVCAWLVLCACGDGASQPGTEPSKTRGPTATYTRPEDAENRPPSAATPTYHDTGNIGTAPPRLQHEAVHAYGAIAVWHNARAQCSATQGSWGEALAACVCPAQQVFAPPLGCVPANTLVPRLPGCEDAYSNHNAPTRCLKELLAPGLAVHLNWGPGKRARQAFAAHALRDWTRWFGGALALPTVPGTLHLANGRRFHDGLLAWLDFDGNEPLPLVAPWSPRAAMHEGAAINLGPACAAALQGAQVPDRAITPLCEGIATTQAAVREPWDLHATELRALVVSTNPQAHVALVQARYAWQRVASTYRVPWAYNVAVNRHIISDDGQGHRVVAFLSPTGTVHAWAVPRDGGWQVFDDGGKAN